ncbi:MAG: hypothetical protein N3C62_03090 [Synergistetes bacterium]|nr:hypothetical protein [Synergistota bacterium]MCX8127716.1 hypothetical protein [Synergistota bacterium]MDW8191369.1 hypothetical protein [Synergistota bacterium]
MSSLIFSYTNWKTNIVFLMFLSNALLQEYRSISCRIPAAIFINSDKVIKLIDLTNSFFSKKIGKSDVSVENTGIKIISESIPRVTKHIASIRLGGFSSDI